MANIQDYGFRGEYNEANTSVARITAVHRERFELFCNGRIMSGRLKASAYYGGDQLFPTAGDFVLADTIVCDECRIIATLPRFSVFTRLDPSSSGHSEQAVAANFDYVFIMQSMNANLNVRRLERYLTLAWQSGATPVVVLTKSDLESDKDRLISELGDATVGVDVIAVSAKDGSGLSRLEKYIAPQKTIVFLGSSGVGKSTLVNSLAGEELMKVGEIREDDSRGRHTTTTRQLIMLKSGAMIIDTPGMRELGMWDVSEGLGQSFADVERFIGSCKYSDCRHRGEPGCAIAEAIERGELSRERFESYKKLKNEAMFSDDKESYLRQKREKFVAIKKANRK